MGILLFNWLGYRLLDNIAENNAVHRLETQLDRSQYDEHQLILIKVPLTHLAYYNTSAAFERANGEIELHGVPYHYVKRRIYNDSVEMLCLANTAELRLRQGGNDYFRLVNDLGQASKPGAPLHSIKSFGTDPYICTELLTMPVPRYIIIGTGEYGEAFVPSSFLPTEEHPPAQQIA